ncbi:FtsX family ABC transporter permease [Nesterenkonia populi]|uniref:FtsX family ABC transporter permease n=1 Tax=Nesterenkonia populi TaxID=1591087 RepID=UPI0011BDECB7|nr:FtsX family ABC transporter permease [Nesterenkonia populi]
MSVLRANLRSSGRRLIAAGITVAISAAFIVGGLLMVDSFTRGITAEAEAEAAGADVIVQTAELVDLEDREEYQNDPDLAEPADAELLQQIDELDGVESAEPIRAAALVGAEGAGLPVSELTGSMQYELIIGSTPEADDELLVSEFAAEAYEIQVGDTFSAQHGVPDEAQEDGFTLVEEDYEVVGIADLPGTSRGLLAAAGMDRLPMNPTPEEIRVVLPEGSSSPADQASVQEQIEQLTGLEVLTHQQVVDEWVEQRTGEADLLIYITLGFGAVAVFVSALVITNTFSVLVAMRQRTMALLRAIGANAAQLRRATLAEGALLGLVCGAAGMLLGWGGAAAFTLGANAAFDAELPVAMLNLTAAVTGLAIGVLVTVLASAWPAFRAGRVSPMAALAPAGLAPKSSSLSWLRTVLGLLLAVPGLTLLILAAGTVGEETDGVVEPAAVLGLHPAVIGVGGAMLAFLGVLLLARLFIPPLVGWLGAALAGAVPGLRATARLAGQNARQVPARTAATASALLVGVTLVVTFTVGASTAERVLYDELGETYPVDGIAYGLSDADQEMLAEDSRIDASAELGVLEASPQEDPGEPVTLLFADPEEASGVVYDDAFVPSEGTAVLGRELAVLFDLEEPVRFEAEGDSASLAGELHHSLPPEAALLTAEDRGGLPAGWDAEADGSALMLRFVEEASEGQIVNLLEELETDDAAFDGGVMRAGMGGVIDGVLLVVLALLGAAVIVSVIGVSNTLSLSVFERRREGALLRAVGMPRRAVGRMISLEALLLAAVALLLGTALGMLFGWAGVASLVSRPDWSVALEVPWLRMGVIWFATLLAALLAAWLPARRMSKVRPAQGLAA